MQETATSEVPPHPQEPIILNPGLSDTKKLSENTNSRGVFATFGILIAGWFFGNLILLAVASTGIAIAAGSTGLVKVPLVSEKFFGLPVKAADNVDAYALENAQEKLNTISTLAGGQTLKSVALDEEEINALFQKQVASSNEFPIVDPKIKLGENEFTFTGKLAQTNAPIEVVGRIDVSGLVASVELVSAKFGKVQIPTFVASNLVDSYLAQVGLTLSGSQIPAKGIKITNGVVSLTEVSNAPSK